VGDCAGRCDLDYTTDRARATLGGSRFLSAMLI
jgi:hypothetical protein